MPSILIIDDEEPIAWALRRAFEREKYAVAVAATAEDGLATGAQARRPMSSSSTCGFPAWTASRRSAKLKEIAPAARS